MKNHKTGFRVNRKPVLDALVGINLRNDKKELIMPNFFTGNGLLIDVRMTGCTQAPCQLNRGQTYNIQVDFLHSTNKYLYLKSRN